MFGFGGGIGFRPRGARVLSYDLAKGATLGPEIIANAADRDFSADTGNWVKGTGVTIANGLLNFTGSGAGSTYYNSGTFISGRVYEYTYTVARVSGSFTLLSKNSAGIARSTSGTFTERITAGANGSGLYILATGGFNGSIDIVSAREVIPVWLPLGV